MTLKKTFIIFNVEKFYKVILESNNAPDHLFQIARSDKDAASIILSDEKFYKPIVESNDASTYLFRLAQSDKDAALSILSNEKLYKPIVEENHAIILLGHISQSHLGTREHTDRTALLNALKQQQQTKALPTPARRTHGR